MVKRILTEMGTSRTSEGTYDPELDKYEGIDMFPKKTAKAREMLKNVPLPPELRDRQISK
ncbi:hypothetical protein LZD49_10400 [Dyadobacter sp. CY261]|uniref:hypothetical protein n=1 Tax=Dyadobacter sp. CY261 TaxID=2907203 RepID=UPI001F32CE1F|nr:hypothetical protein [Dyadobacter sp. CY261]MCF0070882.1 hypothetical protein [Dyadobacter sp. CY261]